MRLIGATDTKRRRGLVPAAAAVAALAGLGVAIAQTSAPATAPQQPSAGGAPQAMPDGASMAAAAAAAKGAGGDKKDAPDFPSFEEVTKDFTKVNSTADGAASMYTLYTRAKDNQVFAELPKDFEKQRLFIATTIASGEPQAGIQFGSQYAYWKRFDKRLALIEPNVSVRSSGDLESQKSRDNLYTDRVILDVPIACMGPGGGPLVDMDDLLVGQAAKFFGPLAEGRGPERVKKELAAVSKAKAFPQNVELAFTLPLPIDDGRLMTLHYSWSVLPENTGYKPREADPRVGFFTTSFIELGKPGDEEPHIRYINRWNLEKADPSLKLSPPKQPIVFYMEHTVPVRYRRWVREGILDWNKAFEKVGFINAVEVYQQDARTGAHMDKDPEDVRYNFFCWNSNGIGSAIGPSRTDPRTGQILDADIVMNDGFIRAYTRQWQNLVPQIAVEGMNPQTLSWLEERPDWDPRLLLSSPTQRERILEERATARLNRLSGAAARDDGPLMLGGRPFDGLSGRTSQVNGFCQLGEFQAMDVALARLGFDGTMLMAMADPDHADKGGKDKDKDKDKDDKAKEDKPKDDLIDGLPENFIGPMIKEVVCHEVGHTMGLRHNFKASSIRTLAEMNTAESMGKAQVGSVMDYNPININFGDGPVQTDWVTPIIGPYDYWAIECGYCADKDVKTALARVGEPDLTYGTDEDAAASDPLARRYDYGKDPLDFCDSRMRLIKDFRGKILDRAVKDGQGWKKARDAYEILLGQQVNTLAISARFIGGSYINRDRKGDIYKDGKGRDPIENVPVAAQRRALKFLIENSFRDEAFGLTPELLTKMTVDKWWDDDADFAAVFADSTWPVHDRVAGIQRTVMTLVLNPATLTRVADNEFRVPSSQDALTLAEVMSTITDAAWSELDGKGAGGSSVRNPTISSLRRTLQRSNLERLIDLSMPGSSAGPAAQSVATLSAAKLREIKGKIDKVLGKDGTGAGLDPYSAAHLADARTRIEKALDAQYIYNADRLRGPSGAIRVFGAETK